MIHKMKKEIFKKWEPIPDIPKRLAIKTLHVDSSWFRLDLVDGVNESRILRLSVGKSSTITYRCHDEMDIMKTLDESEGLLKGQWCLYTVENSKYLTWYHEQSYNTRKSDAWDIIHYAIYTPDECIDVISSVAPKAEWLD